MPLISDIVKKFEQNKNSLKQGAGYLGKRWGCSAEMIREARDIVKGKKSEHYKVVKGTEIISTITNKQTGESTYELKSEKPLSPKEIDELVGVDNINTFVDQIYDKSKRNRQQWDYTVRIRCLVNDFYTKEELSNRLEEIFPKQQHQKISPVSYKVENEILFIYLADIHAGAKVSALSIFGNEYSGTILAKRLLKVYERVVTLKKTFKTVYVVNLGDSLDGWDGFTVKRKHTLGSESNKVQFDIYTTAMSLFFKWLFQSGIGEQYIVRNCLNANHDGNGLSYIANRAIEMYLSGNYPMVKYIHQEKFIETEEFGNHVFAFTHGKDADLMKFPMTKDLTDRLDAWFLQYFSFLRHNSYDKYLHVRKGDLHTFNQVSGKFGDYINIPSVFGSSDYIELNYNDSRAGAVLEMIDLKERGTTITPIYFEKD